MHDMTMGERVTQVILEVFRLNGQLLVAGDRLVQGLGLTSARWQVLGAVAFADRPQPVAWLARSMGLNRQGVQRIVNDLEREGFVAFQANPNHRRAQFVVLTGQGRAVYDAADRLQRPWAEALAAGLTADDLETARRVAAALRENLQRAGGGEAAG